MASISQLSYSKQLAFAYLTCERLYPNYEYFSIHFNFGAPQILRTAINHVYANIFAKFPKNITHNLIKSLDTITPFPEHFNTVLASSALDACTSVSEALEFILDKNPLRLSDISTFATDSIDMYIQEKNKMDYNADPEFEEKILRDPLMIKELDIQKGIILYLEKIENINKTDIETLLQLQGFNGNLNLKN
ncbi:DUF416 family protein [Filimonas effusa]|uniref:DUF416 family protein n=1 Tax=Filimonas effusa TaxID=2508721 RepID=A0A4Q1D9X6_9BACT|nr:DUF416 family protein [Filimonas effusa]RXK85269.1 DUF416 family protein [Filimonas effusa]